MKIEEIQKVLQDIPFMRLQQAELLRDMFIKYKVKSVLELGFYHGVSTCYMAGILDENGGGEITTIDRIVAKEKEPNIEALLRQLGIEKYVEIFYEPRSYTWRLMKFLEEKPQRRFDFCYIDGGHTWDPTGFAFFLVDKLLNPGGIIVFDDLYWTIEKSSGCNKKVTKEEMCTAQVEKVFELLVKTHHNYHNFEIINTNWGFAQKKRKGIFSFI